jgi:hypothetical protein
MHTFTLWTTAVQVHTYDIPTVYHRYIDRVLEARDLEAPKSITVSGLNRQGPLLDHRRRQPRP